MTTPRDLTADLPTTQNLSPILSSLSSPSSWIEDEPSREALLEHLLSLSHYSTDAWRIWIQLIDIIYFDEDTLSHLTPMIQSDWTNAQEFLKMMIGNSRDVNSLQKCVLVPLAENDAHFVDVCDLLLGCLCEAVTANRGASEEETAMKRETGALGKLQDFREVMETLARRAVVCLTNGEEEGETMLRAFAQMYDVAPFALESQLETLLDDDAATILHRLGKQENEDDSAMEEEIEAINELPPLYASLSSPPLHLTPSQLISTLESIHEKLSTTDAERWNERLAALTDIECILASRSLPIDSRGTFLERLRKMPLPDQFADLRSQVTHAACRVLICTSFEYRGYIEEDSSLSSGLFQLIENCLPALMKLCTSGTKLMAVQGVKCLQNVCVNSTGHSKLLSVLCQDIVDKKSKNTNRKMGAVMGLTAALRVWDENCLKNVDAIAKAVRAANSDRDPKVREEARKAYWAMVSCDKTRTAAEEMYAERSREYRNLVKCREEVEREWDEGGVMFNLLNTGVLEAETPGRNRPSTAPSKINSNKRPVSVGKDNRVTPAAKAGRFSTPAKDGETVQSTSKRPSSAKLLKNTPNSESRRTTLAASTASKTSALKTPSVQSQRKSMGTINQRQSYSNSKANNATVHTTPPNTKESTPQSQIINQDKENTPATPTVNHSTPKTGTPIVSLLARPSPLSIEKARSRNALNQVITMLSDTNNPPEQYLAIQVLALFAKENGEHESWDKLFGVVLELLLGLTKNTQNDKCYDTLHFARSPSNKHLGSRYEAQHLYLQGIRSLLQFVPNRFEEKHVKEVMICLLECTNAPFEIVHTCERALQNLVSCTDPEVCFACLIPYLSNAQVDLDSDANPPLLLSALRTMQHLIEFVSLSTLREVTPDLLQLFHLTIRHKSVDMRKATVFVLVEMHCVLGQELSVEGFSDGQKRLIDVYVGRHPKRNAMAIE